MVADIAETREKIVLEIIGKYDEYGKYTNDDVIESVKVVTGNDVEIDDEWVLSSKGNSVNISDLWLEVVPYGIKSDNGWTYFSTLSAAIESATEGDTIYVLENAKDTSIATIDKNITVDTGTKTIKRTSSITVSKGCTLNINGTGKIITEGANALTNNGTLNINDNVTIKSSNSAIFINTDDKGTTTTFIYNGTLVGKTGITARTGRNMRYANYVILYGGSVYGEDTGITFAQMTYNRNYLTVYDGCVTGGTYAFSPGGSTNGLNDSMKSKSKLIGGYFHGRGGTVSVWRRLELLSVSVICRPTPSHVYLEDNMEFYRKYLDMTQMATPGCLTKV